MDDFNTILPSGDKLKELPRSPGSPRSNSRHFLNCLKQRKHQMSEHETPSATIAAAKTKVLVTDTRGRVIAVRKLNALQFYQLARAMGPTASTGQAMDLAVIASAVTRIDTLDFPAPRSESDVEFLIQQLDFDGIAAAADGLRQLGTGDTDGTEAAKN